MHNVLSRRELIVLGYLSKSPRSFKHINVYTTSQKVILKCTFHSETKTEKWLLIFFPFVEQDTDYLLPSSWKQPPMTTAVIGLGLLASLMQFKFMGLSPMRPSPFSFSTEDQIEKKVTERLFFGVLTQILMKYSFFFPAEVTF